MTCRSPRWRSSYPGAACVVIVWELRALTRQTGTVSSPRVRVAIRVEGTVQGVGFRPFVYSLATGLGLGGHVGNDADGVFAEVEGSPPDVERFLAALQRDAPPLARIERVVIKTMAPTGNIAFSISPSGPGGQRNTPVAAD